jgi:hypothetical protein
MGWVVNATPRPLYPQEGPVIHCIEGWMSPRAVWVRAKNLGATGIRSSDCPARRASLYQLSYPGPLFLTVRNLLIPIANDP